MEEAATPGNNGHGKGVAAQVLAMEAALLLAVDTFVLETQPRLCAIEGNP